MQSETKNRDDFCRFRNILQQSRIVRLIDGNVDATIGVCVTHGSVGVSLSVHPSVVSKQHAIKCREEEI